MSATPASGRSSRSGPRSRSPACPTARRSRSPTPSGGRGGQSAPRSANASRGRRRARAGRRPRLQDALPRRRPAYRRVTPLASRREMQRRAAVALLASSSSSAGWASACGRLPRRRHRHAAISSIDTGQRALELIRANLNEVTGPGVDLIDDRAPARRGAADRGLPALDDGQPERDPRATIEPLREQIVDGARPALRGGPGELARPVHVPQEDKPPSTCRRSCGAPTARRSCSTPRPRPSSGSTSRTRRRRAVSGQKARGGTGATPKLIAVGGRDLLMLDRRTSCGAGGRQQERQGHGHPDPRAGPPSSWGDDIIAIGTFVRIPSEGLYNLYVVDPSEQQILALLAGPRRRRVPGRRRSGSRPTGDGTITALHIDGDMFTLENGGITRFVSGKNDGWEAPCPTTRCCGDARYSLGSGGGERREGTIYGFDRRTTGSSRSRRSTATTSPSTGSPATRRLGGLPRLLRRAARRGPSAAGVVWITRDRRPPRALEAVSDARGPRPPNRRTRDAPPDAAASDPAPGREPDPPDPGRHLRAHRGLLRRVRRRAL